MHFNSRVARVVTESAQLDTFELVRTTQMGR